MIRIMKYGEISHSDIFIRSTTTPDIRDTVADIIANVRQRGDKALFEYCLKFDKAELTSLAVTPEEIEEACRLTGEDMMEIFEKSARNIRKFHKKQVRNSFIINDTPGIVMGQKVIPVDRAGLYVPGGTAAYPSTVLMDSIPAKIAGVKEVVMVTPPGKDGKVNPAILAAAKVAGIDKI
ncbi:MAG: histidinol dehydrogenase, partial [Clostridia bacterium]|nr:histidinol dehydrogenase [Clostridia bacterium]